MNSGEHLLVNVTKSMKTFGKDSNIGLRISYPETGAGSIISKVIINVEVM